ncbi:hypothetical protein HIM_02254 [Hirsutella minnesotensis 3608]|nr:hypothetical protein HIM_02254 [Hirsutella minnesotensis 3608]
MGMPFDARPQHHQPHEPARYRYSQVPQPGLDTFHNNTLYRPGTEDGVHEQFDFGSPCRDFPNTDDILFVMKTGASEAYEKLPAHLLTSMQCLPDFLIFSDNEMQMGKYHLYDALDRVFETVQSANPEFDIYKAQLACPLTQKECTADLEGAWDLDKYKFLNILVRTWAMRPNRQWYVFAEADSYVFWSNMVLWLRTRADPDSDLYVGNAALADDFPFAHGGSGYVISGQLVRKVIESIPNLAAKYDAEAPSFCCGDLLMGRALAQVGAVVKHALPMFNGERPNTLPFGEGHWCEPILTLHHMEPEQIGSTWQYEQTRTKDVPIQIRELYDQFVAPHMVAVRDNWDNLSDDVCYIGPDEYSQEAAGDYLRPLQRKEAEKSLLESEAHTSPGACAALCEASGLEVTVRDWIASEGEGDRARLLSRLYDERVASSGADDFKRSRSCFQWRYHEGVCCTSSSFKLGQTPRKNVRAGINNVRAWKSGWFLRGINDWIDAKGECGIEWRQPE